MQLPRVNSFETGSLYAIYGETKCWFGVCIWICFMFNCMTIAKRVYGLYMPVKGNIRWTDTAELSHARHFYSCLGLERVVLDIPFICYNLIHSLNRNYWTNPKQSSHSQQQASKCWSFTSAKTSLFQHMGLDHQDYDYQKWLEIWYHYFDGRYKSHYSLHQLGDVLLK